VHNSQSDPTLQSRQPLGRDSMFLPLDGKNGFSMKNPPRQKWFFFRQKLFLQLAGKITIKSIFATTKQVRNIVL